MTTTRLEEAQREYDAAKERYSEALRVADEANAAKIDARFDLSTASAKLANEQRRAARNV